MAKIFAIASGKGGVGKTTSALNLGISLAMHDKNVLVIDSNLMTPNIGLYLGVPSIPVTLNDVLVGKSKVKDAIYEHAGIHLMFSSVALNDANTNAEKLHEVIKKLKAFYDIIILDSPAGLGKEVMHVLNASDEMLVIANPELPSLTDALKTIKIAEEMNKGIAGVILTRARKGKSMKGISIAQIEDMLEHEVIGIVPEDSAVKKAMLEREAVVLARPRSNAAMAYKNMAAKMLGKEQEKNFFENLLEAIGL